MSMNMKKRSMPLPQSPSGLVGQVFGKVMEWTNMAVYHQAMQALTPVPNELFLELGFGTGRFAEMLLSNTVNTFVAGIDPTATMVKMATTRLINRGWSERIELQQGCDDSLPWENSIFDAIIAIHCFQFWPDPDRSITEISRLLRPQGRIVIAFRDHSRNAPDWLPNPMSRSGREVDSAIELLQKHKYTITEHPAAGSSRIIRADNHS
jgi:ubiquinone/menaquinone biosynthesis C-methylase UbiE